MYTIFVESDFSRPAVKQYYTREDLAVGEQTYQWERQMDPYDMIWQDDDES